MANNTTFLNLNHKIVARKINPWPNSATFFTLAHEI